MPVSGGPGVVSQFRVGGEQHGFVYNMVPENPRMYKCDRSTEPGDPPNYRLYMFHHGGAWYAIEGPERLPDGTHPSANELWTRGVWRWMCRHTAVREGIHHWLKYDPRTKDLEPGQDAYLRTTVITHVPGPYAGFQDHELVDHMAPNSDTEDENKGKGKGRGRYGGGGRGGKGGRW